MQTHKREPRARQLPLANTGMLRRAELPRHTGITNTRAHKP